MSVPGAKEWQDHAALIGQITLSWNGAVHQLMRVFIHLTGIESPLADAIFFSSQSDSSQRRLIKRVAEAVGLSQKDEAALNKLLKRLENVSTGRNLAAHIIFGISAFDPVTGVWGAKVVPALATPQDKRLQEDFGTQFRGVERDLGQINADLEHWLIHTPYPQRPWHGPSLPIAVRASRAAGEAAIAIE